MTATHTKYHHGNLKEALFNTALEFIRENSVDALSLRKLAGLLGVNQTAIYSHFKNKNALLAELARHGFDSLIQQSHLVLEQDLGPEKNLFLFADYYLKFARENSEQFKLMFGPMFSDLHPESPGLWETSEASFVLFQSVIESYLKETGSQTPARLATLTTWSFMHGLGYLIIGDRLNEESLYALEHQQLLEQMLAIIKRGITSR